MRVTRRGTEKLIGPLGCDVVDYLNKFWALDNLVDIAAWKKFCEEHSSKDLQSEWMPLQPFLYVECIFQTGMPIRPATLGYFQDLIACCQAFLKGSGIQLLDIQTLLRQRTLLQIETLTSS